MPSVYGLPAPKPTGNRASDINFKMLFREIDKIQAVSQRASTSLKDHPFTEAHDIFWEYTPSSGLYQLKIGGVSWTRYNAP